MRGFAMLLACVGCCHGWQIASPPPELDQALRERISLFYKAHVDGKFRLADEVVAEDSKDYFFEMEKTRFYGFEISSISYSDNFTLATVVVNCDGDVSMPPAGKMRVKGPRTTRWKLIDGKWFWYAEPRKATDTPFGPMQPGGGAAATGATGAPLIPAGQPKVEEMDQKLSADKSTVALDATAPSSDAITVSNTLSGWVVLHVTVQKIEGINVRFEGGKQVAPKGSSRIVFEYKPGGSPPPQKTTAFVRADPTNWAFPVEITFKGAPKPQVVPAGDPAAEAPPPAAPSAAVAPSAPAASPAAGVAVPRPKPAAKKTVPKKAAKKK